MDVWQTFWSTLFGTVVGGAIAAYVSYWLVQRSASISATYETVRTILSEDFTERRRQIYLGINSGQSLDGICRATSSDPVKYKIRNNIIYLLNYYDTITHSIEDGTLSRKVIKRTIWDIMREDHDNFEIFIEIYANEVQKKPRPLFPALRRFRNQWG